MKEIEYYQKELVTIRKREEIRRILETCNRCRYWVDAGDIDLICHPVDPVTWVKEKSLFEVRVCRHPGLLNCQRPKYPDQASVCDGELFTELPHTGLYTGPGFGCNKFKEVGDDIGDE